MLSSCAILISFVVVGVVNAIAWWSTRKPSQYRNTWAITASALSIVEGVAMLWRSHWIIAVTSPGVVSMAVGIVGLAIFSHGGAGTLESAVAPVAPRAVAGDRTIPSGQRIFGVLSFALEMGAVVFWARWSHNHGMQASHIPWYLSFTLAILITTALHECGHVLVAQHFKMRLLSFNAALLQWRRLQGKWTFQLNWDGLFSLGGAVRVAPTDLDHPQSDELCMIAAGPLVNVISGGFLLWAVAATHWHVDSQVWRLLAYAGSFSLIAAITNMLPFRMDCGGYSDGAQILQILTHSPARTSLLWVEGKIANAEGIRNAQDEPQEWPVFGPYVFPRDRRKVPRLNLAENALAAGGQFAAQRFPGQRTLDPVQMLREAWLAQAIG